MVLAFHSIGSELPRRRSAQLGFSLVGAVVVFTGLGAATLESVGFEDVVSTGLMIAVPLARRMVLPLAALTGAARNVAAGT